jgi:hypothetical protein
VQELHVVALSSDGTRLVLATSPEAERGGFSVAVDERLQAALRGELVRPGEIPGSQTSLTPREIQTRLRAGASPEDLARESGLPVARIERFSGPVLSERQRVIDEVRAAVLVRGGRGPSALPLGDAVDEQLPDVSGLKPDSEFWTAWRGDSGTWTVELHYNARSRNKIARWSWGPTGGEVVALDSTALALGHIEVAPRRRRRPPPPPGVLAAAGPPGRRRAAPSREERPAVAPKTAGVRRAATKKAAPKKTSAAKPPTKKRRQKQQSGSRPGTAGDAAVATEAAAAGPAMDEPAALAPAASAESAESSEASESSERGGSVVPLRPSGRRERPEPAAEREQAAPQAAAAARRPGQRGSRASVPSWADVLLTTSATESRSEEQREGGPEAEPPASR